LPRYVIEAAGAGLVSFPMRPIDAGIVQDLCWLWLRAAPYETRRDAEEQDIREEQARRDAEDQERYGRLEHSDTLSRNGVIQSAEDARKAKGG
jgi:hypothetical protein